MLKKRRLSCMGYDTTIITLGGCGVGRISKEEADKAIERTRLSFSQYTMFHITDTYFPQVPETPI